MQLFFPEALRDLGLVDLNHLNQQQYSFDFYHPNYSSFKGIRKLAEIACALRVSEVASVLATAPKFLEAVNDIFDIEVLFIKSNTDSEEENLAVLDVGGGSLQIRQRILHSHNLLQQGTVGISPIVASEA